MKLFCNAKFIYYDKKLKRFNIYNGNMLSINGKVVKFTKKYIKNAEIIDLNNQIVLPGFINAHIHLGESNLKLQNKMTLFEYLNYSEEYNKNLGDDKQKNWDESANNTIKDCIKFGTCAINSIRGHHVTKNFSIKSLCGYPIMKSEKLKCFYEQGISGYKTYVKECKQNNIIPGVFFHSFYSNDLDSFNFAKKCNKITNTFFALHLFEDEESEQTVINLWGKDSIELLIENNLLTNKTILIHGNLLSDEHLKLVGKKGVSIVTCPISANVLKTKHVNIKKLIQNKINWCLATDGLATGQTANLLKNAQMLLKENINSLDLLKSLTINPAIALNLKNELFSVRSNANFSVFENIDGNSVKDIFYNILKNDLKPKETYYKSNRVYIDKELKT